MNSEFQVGQQFKVPGITWTITAMQHRSIHIEITYADGSKPQQTKRTPEDLAWIMRRAKERGRLIEEPKPQEKSENV